MDNFRSKVGKICCTLLLTFFFFLRVTGWQLGWDHHGHHRHVRAQFVSGGHRADHQGSGGQRGAGLPPILHPDAGCDSRPVGVPDPSGLPGAPPPPLAGEATELWHGLRGPLHLCCLQAAHLAAGCLGALLQAHAGKPSSGLDIPGAACGSSAAVCGVLLALLWSPNPWHTGELK